MLRDPTPFLEDKSREIHEASQASDGAKRRVAELEDRINNAEAWKKREAEAAKKKFETARQALEKAKTELSGNVQVDSFYGFFIDFWFFFGFGFLRMYLEL